MRSENFRAEAATMSETAVVDHYFHRSNAMSECIEQWTKMTFDERMHLLEIILENIWKSHRTEKQQTFENNTSQHTTVSK